MNNRQRQPATATTTTDDGASALEHAIAATEKNKTLTESAAEIMGVPAASLLKFLRGVWTTSEGQPDLTNAEMFIGISIVAKYHLDPIAREIYVTKSKGKLMTVIGIDGWIKILDRTEHYDGFDVDIHEDEGGKVDYVDVTIHSKVRSHPATYRAFANEYSKISGFMAGKIPTHMLRIFALRHAARLFVPLGGTVMTEEESRSIIDSKPAKAADDTEKRVTMEDLLSSTQEPTEPDGETTEPDATEPTAEPDKPLTDAERFELENPQTQGEPK